MAPVEPEHRNTPLTWVLFVIHFLLHPISTIRGFENDEENTP